MHIASGLSGVWADVEVVRHVSGIVFVRAPKRKNSEFLVDVQREKSMRSSGVGCCRSLEKPAIGELNASQDLSNPVPVQCETGIELAVSQASHLHAERCIGLRPAIGKKHRMFCGIVKVILLGAVCHDEPPSKLPLPQDPI